MKYNDNGTYKDIYVKAFDTLPIGTEVDYIGDTVPTGWTQVESYSTSEIDTGKTWTDGKKIYRKVVNDTTPSSATTKTINTSITNFGNFISVQGYITKTSGSSLIYIPSSYNDIWKINGVNENVAITLVNTNYASCDCVLILEYVKAS